MISYYVDFVEKKYVFDFYYNVRCQDLKSQKHCINYRTIIKVDFNKYAPTLTKSILKIWKEEKEEKYDIISN
jgi:hypothetical protein